MTRRSLVPCAALSEGKVKEGKAELGAGARRRRAGPRAKLMLLHQVSNCSSRSSPGHPEQLSSLNPLRVGPQDYVRPQLGARSRAAPPLAPLTGRTGLTSRPADGTPSNNDLQRLSGAGRGVPGVHTAPLTPVRGPPSWGALVLGGHFDSWPNHAPYIRFK
ncbi:hypothetical protein NDU88_007913 [Pleurodeles waltl]|uniref:Uncharacterized protein n=1 Tax=Pleurodeles waltl TaxID=8319 RepID=A0AAV7RWG1_PLEWA|nr:hypothetical protein NDU88_007913 [Pleurodeles waltl]